MLCHLPSWFHGTLALSSAPQMSYRSHLLRIVKSNIKCIAMCLCVCPNLYFFSWTLRFPYVSSSGTSSFSTYNQILCLSQHEKMFWLYTKASSESIVFILLLLLYDECMLSPQCFCDFFPSWRKDCDFEDFTKKWFHIESQLWYWELILLYIVFSLQIENSGFFTIFTFLRTRAHW